MPKAAIPGVSQAPRNLGANPRNAGNRTHNSAGAFPTTTALIGGAVAPSPTWRLIKQQSVPAAAAPGLCCWW